MKPHFQVAKLVIGILSILISIIVLLGSCAVNIGAAIGTAVDPESANPLAYLAAGVLLLGVMILVAGIVSIAERNSEKLGGDIACLVMFAITSLAFPVGMGGDWVYATLFFIFTVIFILSIVFKNKDKKKIDSEAGQTVE